MEVTKSFFAKHWKTIAVVAVVIMVAVVIYFYAKGQGKKETNDALAPDVPGDSTVQPLTTEEKSKILGLVNRLHDDISGWTSPLYRDWNTYEELASATDRVFVGVYNLYAEKFNISLKQDMDGESYWIDSNPFSSTSAVTQIYDRFKTLKLN